eukprot:Sspe_Gene.84984::Locus_55817_Transcript_1_1_Confidence_1.000_Length_871::g.84984::m.84984
MGNTDAKLAKLTHFSESDIEKLREKYNQLCKDANDPRKQHKLDKATFLSHFPSVQKEQADVIFGVFNTKHNGVINFDEFCLAMSVLMKGTEEERLEFAFHMWDYDNTGYITIDEFRRIITTFHSSFRKLLASTDTTEVVPDEKKKMTQEELDRAVDNLFKEADTIGDSKITLEEFKAFAQQHKECFEPLETILKAVKSASYWDWDTAQRRDGRRPSLLASDCTVM